MIHRLPRQHRLDVLPRLGHCLLARTLQRDPSARLRRRLGITADAHRATVPLRLPIEALDEGELVEVDVEALSVRAHASLEAEPRDRVHGRAEVPRRARQDVHVARFHHRVAVCVIEIEWK